MKKSAAVTTLLCLSSLACSGPDRDLPSAYRELAVPKAELRSPEARARGRELYLQHCKLCHGERADGQGVRRSSLSARPADFTDPSWRARVTPRHVYFVVREGVSGTPMPAWPSLTPSETWDLVAYLLSVAEARP
jgi:mono/diheme cytochrome c family protein